MKLSNDTKDVLKNYATINANLLVSPGNRIATNVSNEEHCINCNCDGHI